MSPKNLFLSCPQSITTWAVSLRNTPVKSLLSTKMEMRKWSLDCTLPEKQLASVFTEQIASVQTLYSISSSSEEPVLITSKKLSRKANPTNPFPQTSELPPLPTSTNSDKRVVQNQRPKSVLTCKKSCKRIFPVKIT